MKQVKFKYLSEERNRHDTPVTYFRKRIGRKTVRIRIQTDKYINGQLNPAFVAEYNALYKQVVLAGQLPKVQHKKEIKKSKIQGTFSWLCLKYFESLQYKGLSKLHAHNRRKCLDKICADYGDASHDSLKREHVQAICKKYSDTPGGQNNVLTHIKSLYSFAINEGLAETNPAQGIKKQTVKKPFHTATDDELKALFDYYCSGSHERLILALALYTGLRVGNLSRLSWNNVKDGELKVIAEKTRNSTGVEIYFQIHPALQKEIEATPKRQATILVTSFDKPYSTKGLSNKIKDICKKADCPKCSAHSFRKAAARLVAENGATEAEMQSMFGWTTLEQPARYIRAANRKTMADKAVIKLKR